MANEALDALGDRIATGIHAVAAATLCSKTASRAELDLAGEILKADPKRSMPRELAGSVDTFNRHMDTAIESCNRSAGEPTRAARRARLASDLEAGGLVLIDSSTLAELLSRKLAGPDPLDDEDADDMPWIGDVGRDPLSAAAHD
jgi:hypothetical protein